jgi:hypothetical protein
MLTHNFKAKFTVYGLYNRLKEFAQVQPDSSDSIIIKTAKSLNLQVHPNDDIIIQVGSPDSPIKTTDLFATLNTARNHLLQIIKDWNIGDFIIPLTSNWSATVSHLHHDSINKKYIKHNTIVRNNQGASYYFQKYQQAKNRIGIQFPKLYLKVKDIFGIFRKNDILTLCLKCNTEKIECYIREKI